MIAELKPYPEYQSTLPDWFGKVPAHWGISRLGAVFYERGETNEKKEVTDVLSVLKDRGVIPYAEKGRIGNKASEDVGRYKIVRPDDIVMNCMNVIIGSVGRSRYTGCLSPVYYILRRRNPDDDPRFLELLFKHQQFHQSLVRIGNGILAHRMRIPMEKLKAELLPLPPPAEQAAIVRFLDHWNGRLEKAIRAKRKVITLLNEQKQAIIHRAVTRGLDPNVKLKDSGIPWLGEIPEHWESMPNRANLKIRKKLVGERSSEYTLLSLTMRGVIARDMENPTGKFPAEFDTYQEVQPGDLIFCLFDIDETPRGVGISRLNGMITGAYTVFEPRNPEIAEFLYLHYLAMDEEKCLKPLYTGLRKTIPKPRFLGIKTPIPPPDERIAIVRYIKEETVRIYTIINRYEREIGLLREYRTRLTADVVTGKLDVRAAAAQLPDLEDAPIPDEAENFEEEPELEEVE